MTSRKLDADWQKTHRERVAKMPEQIREAHKRSRLHRAELNASEVCGCFYCLATFAPADIEDWTDGEDTALCPKCGIDSVIGSAAGYPLTNDFLSAMKLHWF